MELGSPASAPMSPLALPISRAAIAGYPCSVSGRALHGPAFGGAVGEGSTEVEVAEGVRGHVQEKTHVRGAVLATTG